MLLVIDKLHTGISDPEELEALLAHGSESEVKQALARFSPEDAQKIKQTIQSVLDDSFAGVMDLLAVAALLLLGLACSGDAPAEPDPAPDRDPTQLDMDEVERLRALGYVIKQ